MKKVLSINVVMFNSIFGLCNKFGIKGYNSSKQPKTTFDKRAGNKFNKEIVDRDATITENMHKFNGTIEERLVYSADMYDKADRHPYELVEFQQIRVKLQGIDVQHIERIKRK